MMTFDQFIQWAFLGLLSGSVYILWQLKESVAELNTKIAVVIQRLDSHDQRIKFLEDRTLRVD